MSVHTFESLRDDVFKAADIFRGRVDISTYMRYSALILTMKRMSDVFDEEAELIMQETGNEQKVLSDPTHHEIVVPESAHLHNIVRMHGDLGSALKDAIADLKQNNSNMDGLFDVLEFDFDQLHKNKELEGMAFQMIQHFLEIAPLRNSNLEEPYVVARVYEYLLEQWSSSYKGVGSNFYTPNSLSKLMVSLLEPKGNMSVCDPVCNTGSLLTECERYINNTDGEASIKLYGQEINRLAWKLCKLNMIQHGRPDAVIKNGDAIRNPQLLDENERLMVFDRVIANPPMGSHEWGFKFASEDVFGRFRYGIPPKNTGDFAYLEHMISTLNKNGKLVTIIPPGMLFRGGAEGKIRRNVVKGDLIEAVIGLPPKLFHSTGIPVCVMVVNMNKPEERKDSILFISAEQEYQGERRQNVLRDQDIDKIVRAYEDYKDIDQYCRVVSESEIRDNEYNLHLPRYVDTMPEIETVDIKAELRMIQEMEAHRLELKVKMDEFFEKLGYNG